MDDYRFQSFRVTNNHRMILYSHPQNYLVTNSMICLLYTSDAADEA